MKLETLKKLLANRKKQDELLPTHNCSHDTYVHNTGSD